MRFDDSSVDASQLEDRRGGGRGRGPGLAVGGGGLGIVGLLLALVLGVNPFEGGVPLDPGTGAGSVTSDVAQRCNARGAIEEYDDCFALKVFNEVNEVWTEEFARQGAAYREPVLVYFDGGVQTGCGPASSQVGPFYCPPDERVFIDLGFLEQLQRQFGAEGRYAQAYIVAHEVGHHIQTLTGTERRVRAAQQEDPARANELSVRLELQADCLAGVWSRLADERGNVSITERELDQALGAAEAVGDDRIQEKVQGRVDPESWTHGSAEQRRSAFLRGYQAAGAGACSLAAA